MAVVQISRVQQRRGLQQDLPQLASAEFGWTLDQRRLFIGNGTISEGAPSEGVTEILTQYSDVLDIVKNYTFKGRAAGYTAQTGAAAGNPVKRYWQDKLDDVVSVKDFGATGDGVTNDAAAINRAIAQIYLYNRVQTVAATRRTIYFPAGVYLLSGDVIRIPPWLRIIGDGINSTIIKQTDATQSCVLQFSDSKLQTGSNLGRYNAALATQVDIENLTIQNDNERDLVVIESTDAATFKLVAFAGVVTENTEGNAVYSGVRFKSTKRKSQNINFDLCQFSGLRYHLVADESVANIKINGSSLRGGYHGLMLAKNSGANDSVEHVRISNTVFADMGAEAVRSYAKCQNVVSTGNIYQNVGGLLNGDEHFPAIRFSNSNNYSIADSFTDNFTAPGAEVVFDAGGIELNHARGLTMGTLNVSIGTEVSLPIIEENLVMNTGVFLPDACQFNYRLTRGSMVQVGTIMFAYSVDSGAKFTENYSCLSGQGTVNLGIEFKFQNNELVYIATSGVSMGGENPVIEHAVLSYNITQL